jgi:hypothetical protein
MHQNRIRPPKSSPHKGCASLGSAADALELCDGDLSKLDILQRTLAAQAIDFGKAPPALSDKALERIKEIASKLPTTAK